LWYEWALHCPMPYERKKKTMIRERSLTNVVRNIRNTLRRSIMVKPMLVKNGTQVMRVPSQKVMRWQP
jgi:hypothetical protein